MRKSSGSGVDFTIAKWKRISNNLGLEIQAPVEISLPSGAQIVAPVLVLGFGAIKGTVIVTDFAGIKPHIDELIECGYGFSTLTPASSADYDRETAIEMLSDWEWAGDPAKKPKWVRDIEDEE